MHNSSARTIILNAEQAQYKLGTNLSYYEDAKGDHSFKEITGILQKGRFKPLTKQTPSFGYTHSVYWAHFVVRNPLGVEKDLLLELAHPFMKSIILYYSIDGRPFVKRTGGLKFRREAQAIKSRNHVFSINFPAQSETRFIMRFENGGPMSFPLKFWSTGAFLSKVDLEQIILGMFYGIFIALLIYNFTIFISLKDKSYLYYVIFLCMVIIYQLSADGIGFQYFWKGSEWFSVNSILVWNLVIVTYVNFSRSFLNIETHAPKMHRILVFFMGLLLFNILIALAWDMMFSLKITLFCHLVSTLVLLWTSALCIRNQSRPAKFYLIAMVLLLAGTLATLLKNAGVLPQNAITIWGAHWGTTAEVLLLSIGLADRINTIRNERYLAEKEAVSSKQLYIDTLEKTKKRVNQIFNNAVEGIFQISNDNRLIFANPAMAEIFGYDSVDDMLTSVTDIRALFKNREDYQTGYEQLITNQNFIDYEIPLLRKNGDVFYSTVSIHVINSGVPKGNPLTEGMILDVTDRRLREKAERDLKVAEQANQTKSEFLANVSHELRTPLQAILGYSMLGISRIKHLSQEQIVDYFNEIVNSGNRLLRLLNDLLDLSKLEADAVTYNFERERLSLITDYVVKELASITKPKDITIRFSPPDFDDMIAMDAEKIIQVIRNLTANAIRFSGQNENIDISIEKYDSEYQFSIRDRGVGIQEDEFERIFDKFVQSSKKKKGDGGTGLGLSISKKIVEDHGGRIWAENHPGGGAVFCFRLPELQE